MFLSGLINQLPLEKPLEKHQDRRRDLTHRLAKPVFSLDSGQLPDILSSSSATGYDTGLVGRWRILGIQ